MYVFHTVLESKTDLVNRELKSEDKDNRIKTKSDIDLISHTCHKYSFPLLEEGAGRSRKEEGRGQQSLRGTCPSPAKLGYCICPWSLTFLLNIYMGPGY